MELNLCMGCMQEIKEKGPCPHCGFDAAGYTPSPHHLPPETILNGKYLIGKVLGEGGFGITYLGWDLNLETKVAVKEYYPNGFVTRIPNNDNNLTLLTGYQSEYFQNGLEKFVDEARRLARFWGSQGIVSVKDYFQQNKTAYIVMEFVEGQTLKQLLKTQPQERMPVKQVLDMLRPVMQSLEKVHEAGLIHRDISPDNLMVDSGDSVKLLDFGAARDFMANGEKSLSVMLKPGYAPQEQYSSKGKQGPWTDVYCLCATIYRAITGEMPPESLDRLEEDEIKRPTELGIEMDAFQEAALMKGLAVRPQDRYQSMKELMTDLYCHKEVESKSVQVEEIKDTVVISDVPVIKAREQKGHKLMTFICIALFTAIYMLGGWCRIFAYIELNYSSGPTYFLPDVILTVFLCLLTVYMVIRLNRTNKRGPGYRFTFLCTLMAGIMFWRCYAAISLDGLIGYFEDRIGPFEYNIYQWIGSACILISGVCGLIFVIFWCYVHRCRALSVGVRRSMRITFGIEAVSLAISLVLSILSLVLHYRGAGMEVIFLGRIDISMLLIYLWIFTSFAMCDYGNDKSRPAVADGTEMAK